MPLDNSAPHTTASAALRRARLTVVCPPVEGGVLDYARLIARHTGAALAYYANGALQSDSGDLNPEAPLYIQYSGYGYQRRGVPLAFLAWLKAQKRHGRSIGVFFHELYAMSSPRHSAFWLSPLQRHIAAEIADLSDCWITNRTASAAWLVRAAGHKPHVVLPVCSNVGELTDLPAQRDPIVVVFGGPHFRRMVYDRGGDRFLDWCRRHGLAVHDAGAQIQDSVISALLARHGVTVHGRLETAELSALLSRTRAGATGYPVPYAGKSSSIAAFAAHGCAPIVFGDGHGSHDGLVPGRTYVPGETITDATVTRLADISVAAWQRYQTHAIARHADAARAALDRSRHAA